MTAPTTIPIIGPVLADQGYFEPVSVDEALDILRQGGGNYKPVAGGTDVLINLRRRSVSYRALVNIKYLPGIADWSFEPGKGFHIGAATPFRELELDSMVMAQHPALVEAMQVIGSLQLRSQATIGGNVCNASPAADSAPALMVSGATVDVVQNGEKSRTLPVDDFFAGPGRSILGSEGLMLALDIPEPPDYSGQCFQRFTPRNAMDIAIVSAASQVTLDRNSGRIEGAAVALGAVAPTPIRAPKAEALLLGKEPTPEFLTEAGNIAMDECAPIDDIRGSASYRRTLIGVLVRRTLQGAVERATGSH